MEIKEFLNPKSMLTPGIAGGLVAFISCPLVNHFSLSCKWVFLIASFLLAFLADFQIKRSFPDFKIPERSLCLLLNGLIIFAMSSGVGIIQDPPSKKMLPPPPPAFLKDLLPEPDKVSSLGQTDHQLALALVPPVYAQQTGQPPPPPHGQGHPSPPTPHAGPAHPANHPPPQLTPQQQRELQRYLEERRRYEIQQQEYIRRWNF